MVTERQARRAGGTLVWNLVFLAHGINMMMNGRPWWAWFAGVALVGYVGLTIGSDVRERLTEPDPAPEAEKEVV